MTATKALVTGAYGFVGRHVARALADTGHAVTGLGHGAWDRGEWARWGLAQWHDCDVASDALATYAGKPDIVVHCAGSGSVPYSLTHPQQDFERSVATTLAVLEHLRLHAAGARFVLSSSAGVYGRVETLPIGVDTPLNPVSPYGVHKKIVEELARSYARYFGLKVAVVRLFSVYGVGLRKQLLWDACAKFRRGEDAFQGTGEETRDWLHVEDAARLLVAAAEAANQEAPTVNGGTGVATTNRRLLEILARCVAPGLAPRFVGAARAGDPQHYRADISGATALGWRPQRRLEAEIAAYAEWNLQGAP